MSENFDLNKINNERIETTKKRVAHAIKLISNPIGCLKEGRVIDCCINDIAHAVNLLESASEESKWACKHFNWNDDICYQIDDACAKLGICLSILLDNDDNDLEMAGCEGNDAMSILGKVLATLVRWFDESEDRSEI